jgi:predicted nuclease with TOPRIM domain
MKVNQHASEQDVEIASLKDTVNRLRCDRNYWKAEARSSSQQVEQLKRSVAQLNQQNESLEKEQSEYREHFSTLFQQVDELETKKSHLESQVSRLENQIQITNIMWQQVSIIQIAPHVQYIIHHTDAT